MYKIFCNDFFWSSASHQTTVLHGIDPVAICCCNIQIMHAADPESAYNAANPVYGMRYIVMGGGADGFTSKQWAVCDRRLMKELVNIVYNTRPTVMQSPQDNPLKDLYTAYADFGVGWGDARQIIFGNPS